MRKNCCEKPDFEVVMFETEESVMTASIVPPTIDENDGPWSPTVKP